MEDLKRELGPDITEETKLNDICDSLEKIELIMHLQAKYPGKFDFYDIYRFETIKDILDQIGE